MSDESPRMDRLRRVLEGEPIDVPASRLDRDTLDRARYQRLARERSKRGEKALPGFAEWLIKKHDVRPVTAVRTRAIAWSLYEETGGDPASIFHRDIWIEAATYRTVIDARSAIRRLCDWLLMTSKNPADHEWAREQIRLILNAPRIQRMPTTNRILPKGDSKKQGTTPLTNEQAQRVIDLIDDLAIERRVRAPWYRDVMRILALTGMDAVDLPLLARRDLVVALQQPRKRSWIRVQKTSHRRLRTQIVPLMLVRDEVKRLLAWPFEWRVLADIMAPSGDPAKAANAAVIRIRLAWGHLLAEAVPEVPKRRRHKALRNWVLTQIFRAQYDWVLVAQVSGLSLYHLRQIPWLLEIDAERLLGPRAPAGEGETDVAEGFGGDDDALDDPVSLGDGELDAVVGPPVEEE